MRTQRETLVWKTTTKASLANQSCQNSWLCSFFLSDPGGLKYPEYLGETFISFSILFYLIQPADVWV